MYTLEYLPSAVADIVEIDAYLHEYSPNAADKFINSIEQLSKTLTKHPFMYPIYEDSNYFHHMTLPYKYRLFYHVDEETKRFMIHGILHGMRDLNNIMETNSYE